MNRKKNIYKIQRKREGDIDEKLNRDKEGYIVN